MAEVETLTVHNIYIFFLVLVALAGLFVLFGKVVDTVRSLKNPQDKREESLENHQDACDRKFASDKRELDNHRQRIEALEDGQKVQCAALHALLEHAIHNGNTDEMKKASTNLFNYLNGGVPVR